MAPVQKGDIIKVDRIENIGLVTVEWHQNLTLQSKAYYQGTYTSSSTGEVNILFVQQEVADKFKNAVNDDQIKINKDFQHGDRNNDSSRRFLVYQNQSNRPPQFRFIQAVLRKYGNADRELCERLGFTGNYRGDGSTDVSDYAQAASHIMPGNHLGSF